MTAFSAAVSIGLGALWLRLLPNLLANSVLGVDHWYWKSYIEDYRTNKRIPPQLPQYLLDQHHWYPPVFPLLVAVLPDSLFTRFNQLIAVVVDLLRMSLVLAASLWTTDGDAMVMALAGIIYATSPILVSYNTQLNPRGLGALFLDGSVLLVIGQFQFDGPVWLWGMTLGLTALILLTHKMTTQLFWFLCLAGWLILQDWRLLALIPGSILTALVLSKGFYWRVMQAHWDIVAFWYRNWRWLQAHPVKESPIYGEPGFETPTRFYRKGFAGLIRHLRYLAGFNPGAWVVVAAAIAGGVHSDEPSYRFIVLWASLCLAFSLLTILVPFLRCLGSGYFYLYNAAFPVALTGALLAHQQPDWAEVIWSAVASNLLALGVYYCSVILSRRRQHDRSFDQVVGFLKTAPRGTVMCLPLQWSDVIAYKTGQPVLTGGHGYGFRLFEPLFPRLRMPIQEVIHKFDVRYLVTIDGYLTERFYKELCPAQDNRFGCYHVYVTQP